MRPIALRRTARLIFVGAGALLLAIPAVAVALPVGPFSSLTGSRHADWASAARTVTPQHRITRTALERGCGKLFTVNMAEGAANVIYSGHGQVSEHALGVLGYVERCQRNPAAEGFVRGYAHFQARRHQRAAPGLAGFGRSAGVAGGAFRTEQRLGHPELGGAV